MPRAARLEDLAPFQRHLVGTWTNKPLPGAKGRGGPNDPFSYNIMPLPQVAEEPGEAHYPGYILKNFSYYETMRFNDLPAIDRPAVAPNRAGEFNQNAMALFYDQQVKFAEGPAKDEVVHVENGAWLSMVTTEQSIGPYGGHGTEPGPVEPQPSSLNVAKQIAVPHGNSVLALGAYDQPGGDPVIAGAPTIPAAPSPFPVPSLSTDPYTETRDAADDYQNPDTDAAQHPNDPIREAVDLIKPKAYMHWRVTTELIGSDHGVVTNIPFEQRVAKVTSYEADYWLLSRGRGKKTNFQFLAYTQTMNMQMKIAGHTYSCPHVTCNVLTHD